MSDHKCPFSINNIFRDDSYWQQLSDHEYDIHHTKNYQPNKPVSILQQFTCSQHKAHAQILNMSTALSHMIDEYTLLYTSGHSRTHHDKIRDKNIEEYCMGFLSQRDSDIHQYFLDLLSNKK